MNTIINYGGGTPTTSGSVTIFDSTTFFTPGSLHLLMQKWFQYTIAIGSAGGTGTGALVGQFSDDKGANWTTFYSATSADGSASTPAINEDEVYIGQYKDVRFTYTNATEAPTVFKVDIALSPDKSSSKVSHNAVLVDNLATSS
jgi:hypothetical protein